MLLSIGLIVHERIRTTTVMEDNNILPDSYQTQLMNHSSIVKNHHNISSMRLVQLVNKKIANTNMFPGNYDPMVGIKTAVLLGSFLLVITACVIYKATYGREVWTPEDRLLIDIKL